MVESLRIALAQVNLLVGDVQGNAERVITTARRARGELRADLVLFPELTLACHPPEALPFTRGLPPPAISAAEWWWGPRLYSGIPTITALGELKP